MRHSLGLCNRYACLCCWTVQAAPEVTQPEPAASATKNPQPLQETMPQATNRNGCMNSLLFFDDWFLHAREGLDRRQGQPQYVKEVSVKFQPDPDLKSIWGTYIFYDRLRGHYSMIVDCTDRADKRFFTRLETDDLYNWPEQLWTKGSGPLWTRAGNVYLDQHNKPLDCFNIFSLAGTPLAEKGYVMTLFDYGREAPRQIYRERTQRLHRLLQGWVPLRNLYLHRTGIIICRRNNRPPLCVVTTTDLRTSARPRLSRTRKTRSVVSFTG